jgi:hypothetical protein
MFHKDTNFIISVQLTLIGIVLIIGLYLLWKALSRVEEKIDILINSNKTELLTCDNPKFKFNITDLEDDINNDDYMKNIFKEDLMFKNDDHDDVTIEEVSSHINNIENKEDIEDNVSVSTSVTNEYTKTKLRQMTVDKLKELCDKSGISSEGTKNQMIDRLLSAE